MQQTEMHQLIAERAKRRMLPILVEFCLMIVLFSIVYAVEPHLWLGIPFLVILIGFVLRILYLLFVNLQPRVVITAHNKTLYIHRKRPISLTANDISGLHFRSTKDFNLFTAYLTDSRYTLGKIYITYLSMGKIKKLTLRNVKSPAQVIDAIYKVMGFKHAE